MTRYKHECAGCTYLGQHEHYDLYVHAFTDPASSLFVARFGGEHNDQMVGVAGATHPAARGSAAAGEGKTAMKYTIAILAALALTGCSAMPASELPGHTIYEAAIGANVTKSMPWSRNQQGGFAGPDDTARFTIRRENGNGRTFVSFSHISHLSSGWPVNDERTEDWLDIVEFGVRFDSREW